MSEDTKLTTCGAADCETVCGQEVSPLAVKEDFFLPALMPISEVVRNRLLEAGKQFHCNDNISEFISAEERQLLVDEVAEKMEAVLRSLVIDIDNDHNTHDTARRVAKMYVNETYSGRFVPAPKITSFPNVGYKDLYVAGPITVKSTCAHHFQNIVGKCWVGIFPEDNVIGLSKFNRLVQWITERPQIQEEMTTQIADALIEYAETPNVAVVLKAEHHCMTHRGVKEHESDMSTAIMRGSFRDDPSLKDEFYKIMLSMKGHA
jgi:GTP cyclohydrolase I